MPKEQTMSYANSLAIVNEYPFLRRFELDGYSLTIERWDPHFADESSYLFDEDGPLFDSKKFYLLDGQGGVVARVGAYREPKSLWKSVFYRFTLDMRSARYFNQTRHETVGQALDRIGTCAADVVYALKIKTPCLGHRAVFYKLPREFKNAAQWLDSIKRQATEVAKTA